MGEQGAWSRLRFAGAGHYAEQRLGLSRGAAQDRQRAAHALRPYRVVREAYEQGRLGFEAAKNVLRILDRERADETLQRSLVDHAATTTIKRLRDEARFLRRRAALEPAEPGARIPGPCDDAAWQSSVRREPGAARKRIFRLGARAVESPTSDVFLRLRLPAVLAAAFMACVESARRRLARLVEEVPWDQDWPDAEAPPSVLAARAFFVRCRRIPAWAGLLAMLEDFVVTHDNEAEATRRPEEAIHIRDGYRCTAPGCTSRSRLQCHHVRYRSRRGGEEEWNKTTICEFHHQRGEHGGLARCRGRAPLGLLWRLGRGELASWFRNERAVVGPV